MTLLLACAFSVFAVVVAIFAPSLVPMNLNLGSDDLAPSDSPINGGEISSNTPVSLLFLGDIMLARGVEWRIGLNDLSYPLSEMVDYLSAPDLTIGNFEGTVREKPNQEISGFSFDTTPEIAGTIADAGIDVVSLSNNHSDNYGSAVVQSTRDTINALGMTPFGDPHDSPNHIARIIINDQPLSFIGFHAFTEEPETLLPAIAAEKAAGNFVIVFPHWGNEYQHTPSAAQIEAAHLFVDAGADAIIGAHAHVIQTYENYRGAPIIYSLGNFLFDQDFSVETQQGLTLGFVIDAETITMSFVPVSVIKSRVTLMGADEAAAVLAEHDLPATLKIARPTNQNAQVQQ
jgi:poly-gamma-glutamate synthesis protein (capsule biosynthesis protein)